MLRKLNIVVGGCPIWVEIEDTKERGMQEEVYYLVQSYISSKMIDGKPYNTESPHYLYYQTDKSRSNQNPRT